MKNTSRHSVESDSPCSSPEVKVTVSNRTGGEDYQWVSQACSTGSQTGTMETPERESLGLPVVQTGTQHTYSGGDILWPEEGKARRDTSWVSRHLTRSPDASIRSQMEGKGGSLWSKQVTHCKSSDSQPQGFREEEIYSKDRQIYFCSQTSTMNHRHTQLPAV